MNTAAPEGQPPPADLTARLFRALYDRFDLHTIGGIHIAVPKGTPCFAGPAIGEIARQISSREEPVPAPPDALHRPCRPRP